MESEQVSLASAANSTPREREVLALLADGHGKATNARRLSFTERALRKHIGSILIKLDLPADSSGRRRVPAVLAQLRK